MAPASPAGSLFASDYSLSPVPSLRSHPNSPSPNPATPASPLPTTPSARHLSPRPTRAASQVAPDQHHSRMSSTGMGEDIPMRNLGLEDRKYSVVDSLPVPAAARLSPLPNKKSPIPIVFPQATKLTSSLLPSAFSPSHSATSSPTMGGDSLTALPQRIARKKSNDVFGGGNSMKGIRDWEPLGKLDEKGTPSTLDEDELSTVPILESSSGGYEYTKRPGYGPGKGYNQEHRESKASSMGSTKKVGMYNDCESCVQGGIGHEAKSASYKVGSDKAYHHLQRANDLFGQSLHFRPGYPKGMLAKSKILIQLGMHYQPPKVATASLREAVKILRDLTALAPRSVSAREALAQACALLSNILLETDDTADDESRIWEGEVGKLAREALQALEDVAADRMDKMRLMDQRTAAEQAPSMAEMFLALSSAAITVSTLAMDLPTVDLHIELAEQALDQASNMATVAASARIKSSTSSANLITRVQLASGRSSLERLRHTFLLGADLDEDDFRSLMSDMSMLATECRERAAKLKGSRAASASSLAWESIKQLGDSKMMYASLLRLVWRKRHPRRRAMGSGGGAGGGEGPRKLSSRTASMESTIREEDEDEWDRRGSDGSGKNLVANKPRQPDLLSPITATRGSAPSLNRLPSGTPLGSVSEELNEDPERGDYFSVAPAASGPGAMSTAPGILPSLTVSTHAPTPSPISPFSSSTVSSPLSATGRRGSWLPDSFARTRRQSSMTSPLTGPGGISAWTRKASVISLAGEDEAKGLVSSAELASSAWQLLESAVKQYKLALTLLSSSDLPTAQLARAKTETLAQIAHASQFQASLAARVPAAAEKRTSLLVTAEVYATWAAREVGWSFLIEGTKESALADRRTNSWRADEAGKRAVMLLVRIWWYRAVSSDTIDIDTKTQAKDAVEVVVRRMRDREGVRDGDVARWRMMLGKSEGEMDAAEGLFWRSVSRILRGGAGFVMS